MSCRAAVTPQRQKLLARVHIARKEMALDEASYRDLLRAATGKDSAADCSDAQLEKVLRAMKGKGWKPAKRPPRRAGTARPLADGEHQRKIRALWLSLYHLGAVRDPSERSIDGFVKRQAKVDTLAWLPGPKAGRVIEALKDWCARAGFEVPADDGHGAKVALVRAIWARLEAADAVRIEGEFALWQYVDKVVGPPRRAGLEHLDEAQLDVAVERLGRWLRAATREHSNRR